MVLEYVLRAAGEMCVHFVILVGTSLAIAYYLENLQDPSSLAPSTIIGNSVADVSAGLSAETQPDSTLQGLQDAAVESISTVIANITEQSVESEL